MNKSLLQPLRPLLIVFAVTNGLFITGRSLLDKNGISQDVLIIGNLVIFAVTLLAFYITYKSFQSGKPQVFVRAMYSSFMLRFFLLAAAAFVYIMIARPNVNKPALIICAGLYIVYTAIETRGLIKMLREKKNA